MRGEIDVVVGGQYGDEGKGAVALWLASHLSSYGAYVRTGGENAEHRVEDARGEKYTFRILPTAMAAGVEPPPTLVLAAGMTFSLEGLRREMERHPYAGEILVDRNAAIITESLRRSGLGAARGRGSTFTGVGATMAEKVRRAGGCKVAGDYSHTFVKMPRTRLGNAANFLHSLLSQGQDILLEASQGTMLSLDHGFYPFCTSRNVTAMGALSDAGLNWRDIRSVYMVVKTVPTRVPGNSGPTMEREMTWEEVCERAGRPYEEIHQTRGGGAGGVERPFQLSLEELGYASRLNGATAIVVTFLDWWNYADLGVSTWGDLSHESRKLISDIERVTRAPVRLVRTGPHYADYLYPPYGA